MYRTIRTHQIKPGDDLSGGFHVVAVERGIYPGGFTHRLTLRTAHHGERTVYAHHNTTHRALRNVATWRGEWEACEAGTVGCCIDHSDDHGTCEGW